ncbi:arylsulfotransferase family protein [Candidatus Kapabacteria bacterium]|nr:arylsulfotransferase family protein [Candidatus Kapabacteria bacterium]
MIKLSLILIALFGISFSQNITYTSPIQNSEFARPNQTIIIRFDDVAPKNIEATLAGTLSGELQSEVIYTSNPNVINIRADKSFKINESVNCNINLPNGNFNLNFQVAKYVLNDSQTLIPDDLKDNYNKNNYSHLLSTQEFKIPDIKVETYGEQAKGYYYVTPSKFFNPANQKFPNTEQARAIIDNYGTVVYWEPTIADDGTFFNAMDFKLLDGNKFGYFALFGDDHFLLDSKMNFIDTTKMNQSQDYYLTIDIHDFTILENGNYGIMSYPRIFMDLTNSTTWGNDEVVVQGSIVQEIDEDNNLIFEWNGYEHVDVSEIPLQFLENYDNSTTFLDLIHMNSFEFDTDTSLVFSQRNLNEVCKINKNTGDYFWRIANAQHSDYEIISDLENVNPLFETQHDARMMDETSFTIFDNGPHLGYSRGCTYFIDYDKKTATLIREFNEFDENKFNNYGQIMGNMQTLDNGNKVVGWGSGGYVTEFDSLANLVAFVDYNGYGYRSFKFDFMPEVFSTNIENLDFSYNIDNTTLSRTFSVTNLLDEEVQFNGSNLNTENFRLNYNLPVTLLPGDTIVMEVEFLPYADGSFSDVLTVFFDEPRRRLSFQVDLKAEIDIFASVDEKSFSNMLNIAPNPVSDQLTIFTNDNINGEYSLEVIDNTGNSLVNEKVQISNGKLSFSLADKSLHSGFYVVKLSNDKDYFVSKFIKN